MVKPLPVTPEKAGDSPVEYPPSVGWAMVCLALSMLMASLGTSIANIALPALSEAFAAPFRQVQWVVIAYLLAGTIAAVGMGWLGDALGHRRVLIGGTLLFLAASIVCGLSSGFWLLLGARAVQGAGAAALTTLAVALVRKTVPAERTGRAMGLLGTTSAIGTSLGLSLGGVLIESFTWRAIFIAMTPLAAVNLLLAIHYLPADRRPRKWNTGDFDIRGATLLGLTLAAYTMAATVGDGQSRALNIGLLAAALIGGGLFLRVETRVAAPLIVLPLFRNRILAGSLVMNILVSAVITATLVIGPFFLTGALGLSAARVGLVMSLRPLISMVCGILAGRVVDRLGASSVVIAGLAGMIAGAAGLSALPAAFGVPGFIAAIAVLTPGYQLFQAANNTVVMLDADPARHGVIAGLLNLSRNLGLITGASVMGALFSISARMGDIRGTAIPSASASRGMQITFLVATGLMVVALGISLALRNATAARFER